MFNFDNEPDVQSFWSGNFPQEFEPKPIRTSPTVEVPPPSSAAGTSRGDLTTRRLLPFPCRLHQMLEDVEKCGKDYIVSWTSNGQSFKVHHPGQFVKEVAPVYFNLTQYKSFKRQLLNYGFARVETDQAELGGAFHHPLFTRDDPNKCHLIARGKTSGQMEPNVAIRSNQDPKVPRESLVGLQQIGQDSDLKQLLNMFLDKGTSTQDQTSSLNLPTIDKTPSHNSLTKEAGLKSDVGMDASDDDFSSGSIDASIPNYGEVGVVTMDWLSNNVSLTDLSSVLESYKAESANSNNLADMPVGAQSPDYFQYKDEILSLFR